MDFLEVTEAEEKPPTSPSPSHATKLVPWLSWTEWESVRDSLFSGSPDKVSFALKRISTWQSRGSLPDLVKVTASILEIQQKDPFFVGDSGDDVIRSEQILEMLYCMAILRLVNSVTEKACKKNDMSIAVAAEDMGIPRTVVDLRHEGSHRELPSLALGRYCAVQSIDWLRANYWEPQTEQIPFQSNGTSARKKIKSQLRKLASCLKDKQPDVGSLKDHKSDKKQINKSLKKLCRLYSSFSSELISLLFDNLCKAVDSLDPTEHEDGQETHSLLDVWKLVIVQLARKEPELLLMLLKAVLNKIEHQKPVKCETAMLEQMGGTGKIELSSLFGWLVEQLQGLKLRNKNALTENKLSSMGNAVSRDTLVGLLRKCLLMVSHGNVQLLDSAMHLSQLIGSGSSTWEKLKKLSLLSISSKDAASVDDSSSSCSTTRLLSQHNSLIEQAESKLQSAKCRRYKRKHVGAGDRDVQSSGRWIVVESWNPCPIGMLPRELGSSGRLPDLDVTKGNVRSADPSMGQQTWGLKRCRDLTEPDDGDTRQSCKTREAGWDIDVADNASVKRIRESSSSQELDAGDVHQPYSVQGCLFSNGVWKKVGEEELVAIHSGLRILV